MSRDPLAFLREVTAVHGDVTAFSLGREHLVVLLHPDAIRDVLVTSQRDFHKGRGLERAKILLGEGLLTSEGEFHRRQRRLAQPAFHRNRVAAYGQTMSALAARRASRWRPGEPLDVHAEMMALTLAIVGRTLFDADVEAEASEIGAALTQVFEAFNLSFFLPFGEYLDRLPIPPTLRFRRARARLDATIYRLIAERRASGRDHGDLLSMLMLARDEEAEQPAPGAPGHMDDRQLRDEAMTIFLAGHETTAVALTWTWQLLSQHPDVEARLHAEVDALGGRLPTADDLPALPWTRQVLAESMRLYPPVWVIGRRALVPFEVEGHPIPARAIVLLSQWLVHHDPRWWPDPERFDPDRWAPGRDADRPRFAYFPFGGGARVCIGEHFAWMEGVLLLATIAQRWRFAPVPGAPAPSMQPIITLRPRNGLRLLPLAR